MKTLINEEIRAEKNYRTIDDAEPNLCKYCPIYNMCYFEECNEEI